MPARKWLEQSTPMAGAPGARRVAIVTESWRPMMLDLAANGFRLLALWAKRAQLSSVHAVLLSGATTLQVDVSLPTGEIRYAGIADIFPSAGRMQRAAADICGVFSHATDPRPWLSHAAWPPDYFPLVDTRASCLPTEATPDAYPFVRVMGDGVHEIPVGPVHAGIIEPGHFRFSVVGEKVLRLE